MGLQAVVGNEGVVRCAGNAACEVDVDLPFVAHAFGAVILLV